MSESEMKDCMKELVGEESIALLKGTVINSTDFCDKILGLEEDMIETDYSTICTASNIQI